MNIYQVIGTLGDMQIPDGVIGVMRSVDDQWLVQMRLVDFLAAFPQHKVGEWSRSQEKLYFDSLGVQVFALSPISSEVAA